MKEFFERYSYDSMRMLLNQVAIAIFGFALSMTAVKAENDTLMLITSIGSIVFYLVLIYGVAWRTGSRDKITVDRGRRTFKPLTGVWISVLANSVNWLLAILMTVGVLTGVQNLEGIPRFIAMLAQGMYLGVINLVKIGENSINLYWWTFFLLPVPAVVTSLLGYIAGVKDFHITKMGVPDLPASDRPTKQEMREKKKAEREKRGKDSDGQASQ